MSDKRQLLFDLMISAYIISKNMNRLIQFLYKKYFLKILVSYTLFLRTSYYCALVINDFCNYKSFYVSKSYEA